MGGIPADSANGLAQPGPRRTFPMLPSGDASPRSPCGVLLVRVVASPTTLDGLLAPAPEALAQQAPSGVELVGTRLTGGVVAPMQGCMHFVTLCCRPSVTLCSWLTVA